MRLPLVVLAVACIFPATALARYQVTSPYLKDPANNIQIIVNEAELWTNAKDLINGGFDSYVDQSGHQAFPPDSWWNTTMCGRTFDYHLKSVVGQSRVAYTFVRAFQVTGDESYLDLARHALTFLYAKGWDGEHGGWWFSTDGSGQVAPWLPCDWWDPNTFKWTYAQMYPLVGIGAMLEATVGRRLTVPPEATAAGSDYDWYRRGLAVLNDRLWDSREGYLGYYESAAIDWSNPQGKGFTGTVDGISTHGAPATHLTWDRSARERLEDLADIASARLISQIGAPAVVFGFPATYDGEWNVDSSSTTGDVGHILKTSWMLGRAFMALGDSRYRDGATAAMRAVLDGGGYDFANGAPFNTFDWTTGEITHGKIDWMIEQAVLSGLVNWHVARSASDRDDGLMIADQSLDFFTKYQVDWELGGHFYQTDDAGSVTNSAKGNIFEQGYHTSELGYFAYLYASVFVKQEPFHLYYRFAPTESLQLILLEPAEFEPGTLRIANVTLDGRPFPTTILGSVLVLPPHVGGKFKVTFAPRTKS